MIPWATKQKMRYTIVFISILVAISFMPLYIVARDFLEKDETCNDGLQNQNETGVDCGGICVVACMDTIHDLKILWSRIFKVDTGVYDAVAFVENVNAIAGIKKLEYTFEVQDEDGNMIYTREGSTYVNKHEQFVIFEPYIRISEEQTPSKAFFTFQKKQEWIEISNPLSVPITVREKELIDTDTSPRLNVTLANTDELRSYSNLDVVALVEDLNENIVAAASTYIEHLEDGEETDVFFTWTTAFPGADKSLCGSDASSLMPVEYLYPADVMLVFDRSGSMNDDGAEPPQPLTDAKEAAQLFIDKMQSVDQVGLVSFATEASSPIDQELTLESVVVKQTISSLSIGVPDYEQHTNLGAGIRYAAKELNSSRHNYQAKKAMVVLTDGITSRPLDPNNLSDDEIYPQKYARAQALGAQSDNIMVYVIGLGGNLNEGFLRDYVASTNSHYYKAANSSELSDIYAEIALSVCENRTYKVQIFVRGDTMVGM